jgi:hypothetical protein
VSVFDAVRNYLPSGKFSFKRITRQMGDKYNQNNMNYYQHFVNYVSQMDPSKSKYFDESGFKLTTAQINYGHVWLEKNVWKLEDWLTILIPLWQTLF